MAKNPISIAAYDENEKVTVGDLSDIVFVGKQLEFANATLQDETNLKGDKAIKVFIAGVPYFMLLVEA